jgi:hypothetical protein
MAEKPQAEPIVWSIFQVAAKAVRLGASHEADGDTAMTPRKGESPV